MNQQTVTHRLNYNSPVTLGEQITSDLQRQCAVYTHVDRRYSM